MPQELTLEDAKKLLFSNDLTGLKFERLVENITKDRQLGASSPDGICQIDPRTGELIIYNSSRAKRPHTVTEPLTTDDSHLCPICNGDSSEIFDLHPQSEGFTFINKNIYPIFHPIEEVPVEESDYFLHQDPEHNGRASYGFHFLQWTSSIHHKDWHNLPFDDARISFQRLALFEEKLLSQSADFMPHATTTIKGRKVSGYVSIIKNFGAGAGASLSHGHQQIAYSNILPQCFYNNLRFRKRNNKSFSQFMLEENPASLMVKDFGKVVLLVPYFMKRPLDMLLILKDYDKRYLHELTVEEEQQMVAGVQQASLAIIEMMNGMGQPPAYNMIINNGPGCGLYIEFLAQTQKMGGYERIGLFVCQGRTIDSARQLGEQITSIRNG